MKWKWSHLCRIPQTGPRGQHSVKAGVSLAQVKDGAECKLPRIAYPCLTEDYLVFLNSGKYFHETNNFEMFTNTLH